MSQAPENNYVPGQENDNLEPPENLPFGVFASAQEPAPAPVEEVQEPVKEEPVEEPVQEESVQAEPVQEPAQEPVQEEPVQEPVEEAPAQEPAPQEPPAWLSDYVATATAHYQNLRSLIKYTKTKDENISKISAELQKYREDYCAKSFKSLGNALISFREDCRKSLRDIAKYQYNADKVRKYLDFLGDDYVEMLSNVGIEECDEEWLFNGTPIRQTQAVATPMLIDPFSGMPAAVAETAPEMPVLQTAEEFADYLKAAEDGIKEALVRTEALDKCLQGYITFSFNVEKDMVKLFVLPAVRLAVSVGKKLRTMAEDAMAELTDENCNEKYTQCLEYVIGALEDVLYNGGIKIETDICDTFDAKRNRLMKAIPTEDPEMDRKIATTYTECYTMNEKIIYPSKVDVYKFAPKAEK